VVEALQGLETILRTDEGFPSKKKKSKSFFVMGKPHIIKKVLPTEPCTHLPYVTKLELSGNKEKMQTPIKISYLNTFVQKGATNNKVLTDYIDSHLKKNQLFPIGKHNIPTVTLTGTPQKYYFKTPIKTNKFKNQDLINNSGNKSSQK